MKQIAGVILMGVSLFACEGLGSSGPGLNRPPTIAVASVAVSPVAATVLLGMTVQFTATVEDAAGNVLTDRTVEWSSADTTFATVDSTGVATGVGLGSTTITATAEGESGSASITVN